MKRCSSPTAFRSFCAKVSRSRSDEAHCAVLYRTNSQSRLVEEALRRYNISYTMVGGFSFYERAEIKDLLGYLRLVRNPHDSMALQRVINTPARGIGKTTLETLERLALETGQSTWDAIGAAIHNRLIPTRALMALESFRQLILDAQAMMDPDFAGKLSADVAQSRRRRYRLRVRRGRAECGREAEVAERWKRRRSSTLAATKTRFRCSMPASFSPFAEAAPKRPFLQDAEASRTQTRQQRGCPRSRLETREEAATEQRMPNAEETKRFARPAMRRRCPS